MAGNGSTGLTKFPADGRQKLRHSSFRAAADRELWDRRQIDAQSNMEQYQPIVVN